MGVTVLSLPESEQTLHVAEWLIDDALVQALLMEQCPDWAELALQRLNHSGTDNVIYRLGDEYLLRLPRTPGSAERTRKEQQWLPRISEYLPLPVPVPVFMGQPSQLLPGHWSVVPWIKGQTAHHQEIDEPYVAQQLAGFLTAIQQLPTHDDLLPGKHNFYRDVDLLERDAEVQAALVRLAPLMDISSAAQIWQKLRDTPSWQQPPVLIHGDLLPTNILFEAGRITAILDFGGLGIGDPACDLIPAWSLLSAAGRAQLRPLIHHDQDTWMRGQGWALSIGLIPLPYYRKTLPDFAALAMHMIQEVIHDYRH